MWSTRVSLEPSVSLLGRGSHNAGESRPPFLFAMEPVDMAHLIRFWLYWKHFQYYIHVISGIFAGMLRERRSRFLRETTDVRWAAC